VTAAQQWWGLARRQPLLRRRISRGVCDGMPDDQEGTRGNRDGQYHRHDPVLSPLSVRLQISRPNTTVTNPDYFLAHDEYVFRIHSTLPVSIVALQHKSHRNPMTYAIYALVQSLLTSVPSDDGQPSIRVKERASISSILANMGPANRDQWCWFEQCRLRVTVHPPSKFSQRIDSRSLISDEAIRPC
jgi:hypothetical protein